MRHFCSSVWLMAIVLATAPVLCSGKAWSVNIATGFTSFDYSGLPSTVTNASDAHWYVRPAGSLDWQRARVCTPGGGNWPFGQWLPNSAQSAWIAVSGSNYSLGAGSYYFVTVFNASGNLIPNTAMLTGSIGCDNECSLLLNGVTISRRYVNQYGFLAAFKINVSGILQPGSNYLALNFTDEGLYNGVRLEGSVSATPLGYWSINVATGYTTRDYSGSLSTVNNAPDANWMVTPPGSTVPQPARQCIAGYPNFPVGAWVPNGPASNWVAVSGVDYSLGYGGPYNFSTTFILPADTDLSSLSFSGSLTCDNYCNLMLNDQPLGPHYISPFATLVPFAYNGSANWILGGLNVLSFNFTDAGTYNGIRIEASIEGKSLSSSPFSSSSSSSSSSSAAIVRSSSVATSSPSPLPTSVPSWWMWTSSSSLSSSSSTRASQSSSSLPSASAAPLSSTAGGAAGDSGGGVSGGVIATAVLIPLVLIAGIVAFAYYRWHTRQPQAEPLPPEQLRSHGKAGLLSYTDAHFGFGAGSTSVSSSSSTRWPSSSSETMYGDDSYAPPVHRALSATNREMELSSM